MRPVFGFLSYVLLVLATLLMALSAPIAITESESLIVIANSMGVLTLYVGAAVFRYFGKS